MSIREIIIKHKHEGIKKKCEIEINMLQNQIWHTRVLNPGLRACQTIPFANSAGYASLSYDLKR